MPERTVPGVSLFLRTETRTANTPDLTAHSQILQVPETGSWVDVRELGGLGWGRFSPGPQFLS